MNSKMSTPTIVGLFAGLIIVLLSKENAALKNDVPSDALLHRQGTKVGAVTQCASPQPLGMESRLIPDSAITASSWLNYNTDYYGPQLARLNNKQGPWVEHSNDQASWIQVDVGGPVVITGLQTQGATGQDKSVKTFKVKTGIHLCNMDYVSNNGDTQVFRAGTHAITTHTFTDALQAQYIRIEPKFCREYCALRFEVLGCLDRWVEFNDASYLLAHQPQVDYNTATKQCTARSATLASIDSQEKQDFLAGRLSAEGYYIGLNDIETEGTFVWPDATPLTYTKWASKPKNTEDKDCVAMREKYTWKWKPRECSKSYGYICEKAVNTRPVLQPDVAVCNQAVTFGLQSSQLPNSRITASTKFRGNRPYHSYLARLNTQDNWIPDPSDNNPWIQVDLHGSTNIVSGVITQGAFSFIAYISAFKVRAGTRECDLRYITENGNSTNPKVFDGNSDQHSMKDNMFPNSVKARFVRIEPTEWTMYCALRLEVIGCFVSNPIECYTDSAEAKDYQGHVSTTKTRKNCQKWTSQSPHSHNETPANYTGKGLGDHNYCRNPNRDPKGAYCYTTDPNTRKEYCNIGQHSATCATECYTDNPKARDYRGHVSVTITGKKCIKWTSLDQNHQYGYTPDKYPGTGLGDHNYCRNPDGGNRGAWCFTDLIINWDTWNTCDIGKPKETCECYTDNFEGKDYRGHVSVTQTGKTCQDWTSQKPHTHMMTPDMYPGKGLGDHNYCRNPDGQSTGPWCYTNTTDPATTLEFCNITMPSAMCEPWNWKP